MSKCKECKYFHTEESKNPNIQYSQRPMCRRYGDIGKMPHPSTLDCFEPREGAEGAEMPPEASPLTSPARKPTTPARRTPRNKLQPGGYEGAYEGSRILLTPKQVEFLERLPEQEEWRGMKESGEYFADVYAEYLADTMSPMAVGAMVTTLREKGVITTEYTRGRGKRLCKFQLTALGRYVYARLSSGEV